MRIEEIMSRPAVTCRDDQTLNVAAHLLWERDCGAVPVVDNDGRVVGVVTDRDICMAAYTQGRPLYEIPVSRVMAQPVYCCRSGETVESAERLMMSKKVRRLPVVDDEGRAIGVISLNDLARETGSLPRGDVARTLAAISQPGGATAPRLRAATLRAKRLPTAS